jgi:hypothetical protein
LLAELLNYVFDLLAGHPALFLPKLVDEVLAHLQAWHKTKGFKSPAPYELDGLDKLCVRIHHC